MATVMKHFLKMKIWHGKEYNNRGEKQLIEYLDDYHVEKGYMIIFSFLQSEIK